MEHQIHLVPRLSAVGLIGRAGILLIRACLVVLIGYQQVSIRQQFQRKLCMESLFLADRIDASIAYLVDCL